LYLLNVVHFTLWQVLIKLMMVKLPITEADAIRALACKVSVLCILMVLRNYSFITNNQCKVCAFYNGIFVLLAEANDVTQEVCLNASWHAAASICRIS